MMKSIALLLCLLASTSALASRTISSLPWSESFSANNYGDLVWITQGATHTFVPTGGYQGGGAAKFTGPNSEGYSGIGQVILRAGLRPTQMNVRFLIWHGRTYNALSGGGKLLIMNREGNRGRPMLIYGDPAGVRSIAACDGTVCAFRNQANGQIDLTSYWADGRERLKLGSGTNARSHEWISIEAEGNTAGGGTLTLYIDTQDGQFRDVYLTRPLNDSRGGGQWFMTDIIGGYMNRGPVRTDPENYFIIDELAVSDRRIGPPAGFRGGTPPVELPAPTNLRLVQ